MAKRLLAKYIIIFSLIIIHLLPIWIFKYFPTQDGPSHIYNAYVLKDYNKHENYKIREVFKLNLTIFPNWASHAIMALLMYVFPPMICEKILVSLCIALLPLSLFYFLNAVDRDKMLFSLLGFIYAYNYLLLMGFYNFALSMPMFFFTLGYWWKHKDNMKTQNIALLYILLLGTYLCHYQSYFQLILSLSFFAVFSYLYSGFVEIWGHNENLHNDSKIKLFIVKLKPLLIFFGYMLPAYFIMLSYYLSSTFGYAKNYWDMKSLKDYFWGNKSLVYFRDDHILIMRIMMGFLALAFLMTLYDRIVTVYRLRRKARTESPDSDVPKQRLWTRIINGKEQFLIMAGILTVIFFKSPWGLGSGGGWINDRAHIYIFLVILPFFSVNFHRYIRSVMAGVMIILSLWHLGYSIEDQYYLNKEIADLASGVGMLEENTALTALSSNWNASDYLGTVKYVSPFLHAPNYYCLENRVAYTLNYEANLNYFPINFKGGHYVPEDYVLTWWLTDENQIEVLKKDYELIHSGKHSKLYRLKRVGLDKSLWEGREAINFDMQTHGGQTTLDHFAIYTDTIYADGRYGWVINSIRGEYLGNAEIPEPYRDCIWGEEDAVFKVALPNGRYKVTCYLCSAGLASKGISIIANGDRVIVNLKIPAGEESIKASYTTNVMNEQLVQVIYAHGKGTQRRWGWSGCVIERLH